MNSIEIDEQALRRIMRDRGATELQIHNACRCLEYGYGCDSEDTLIRESLKDYMQQARGWDRDATLVVREEE